MQLTLMSARVVDLVAAGDRERWALAGDQLYVDFDISVANLPPGTQLAVGSAVVEVTAEPHTGCAKFAARFGGDAHRFVNVKTYRHLRLRGLNAKVIEPGTVATRRRDPQALTRAVARRRGRVGEYGRCSRASTCPRATCARGD